MQALGRQPLFQLLAALIVLLIVDWQSYYGLVAAAVWIIWVATSTLSPSASSLFAVPK